MFTVETADLNRVAGRLEGVGRDAAREAGRLLRSTAIDVEADAKRFAPVRTGTLRRSISHQVRHAAGGVEAIIGSDVPYARYVEQGTSRMAPQAFLGPALDRHIPDFVDRMSRLGEL